MLLMSEPTRRGLVALILAGGLCGSRAAAALDSAQVRGDGLRIEFDAQMRTRIVATLTGKDLVLGPFAPSETLQATTGECRDFALEHVAEEALADGFGPGRRVSVSGHCGLLRKTVLRRRLRRPSPLGASQREVRERRCLANRPAELDEQRLRLRRALQPPRAGVLVVSERLVREPARLGAAARRTGSAQENFQGMNASDYGGGTPVARRVAPRRRARGRAPRARAEAGVAARGVREDATRRPRPSRTSAARVELAPGETLRHRCARSSPCTAATTSQTLSRYRRLMVRAGRRRCRRRRRGAFEPIWCAWGYGREFTPEPGGGDVAGREAPRLRLGRPGRRLAGGRGRLDARPAQVSRAATRT